MDGEVASVAAPPPQLHNVFVYGSLMTDEVVQLVLKRLPRSSPAVLHGYHRFKIKGRIYPAILPADDGKVIGKVLLAITDHELHVLDIFEDVEYWRSSIEISLIDTSEVLKAYAYIWANQGDPNLYGEWDFEEWKQLHMEEFLRMTQLTVDFMEEVGSPELSTDRPI